MRCINEEVSKINRKLELLYLTDKIQEDIVICNECRKPEYDGSMIWFGGKKYCRRCTYKRWDSTEGISKNYDHSVFPNKERS